MIAAAWALLRSKIAGYLAAIGVAAGILFAAYSKGKTDAKANATSDRLAAANKARSVEHEVDGLGDDDVSKRLDGWMRDSAKGK